MVSKDGVPKSSPKRDEDGNGSDNLQPGTMAFHYYEQFTKEATKKLMDFLSDVLPGKMSVTYFDEAQELGSLYWVLLHLMQHQSQSTKMWYTFMGTTSRLSDYAPPPRDSQSPASLHLRACVSLKQQCILRD